MRYGKDLTLREAIAIFVCARDSPFGNKDRGKYGADSNAIQ